MLVDQTVNIEKIMKTFKALIKSVLPDNLKLMNNKILIPMTMNIEILNKMKKQKDLLKLIKWQMIIQLNISLSINKMKTILILLNALL